jgi:bacterioferritin-associated ferredoxin
MSDTDISAALADVAKAKCIIKNSSPCPNICNYCQRQADNILNAFLMLPKSLQTLGIAVGVKIATKKPSNE